MRFSITMCRSGASLPICLWGVVCLVGAFVPAAVAQPPGMVFSSPEQAQAAMAAQRAAAMNQGQPSGATPKPDGKKTDEKKEEGKKKEDEQNKQDDKTVKRPDKPPTPPDPRELEAEPDASGRVTFSFHGQAWADVLQWLANVSELSLDWRELPGDYLNLTTQRSYTLAEARDLINRHLQARGYALLLDGEVLSVFKLDKIDPSLVPRVSEEELYDRQPHDMVKLSMPLPEGMDPKQAIEDVKQALSPQAKAMPLAATKRILLIDNVANLRMVSALLNAERLEIESRETLREFPLKHINAAEVIDTLYVILGLDPQSRPSQMELMLQQKKLEIMQQMTQRGKDVMSMLKKDGPPVYLAYNRQRNSVIANAPPEHMKLIERAIESLDVPAAGDDPAAVNSERVLETYRLKAIDPTSVVSTIEEIGDLSPRAELRADSKSKTLFARASASDQVKIAAWVDQLDGTGMQVEVFWLRRLPADAVAGSIQSLIIQKKKKKKKNNNPFFFDWRSNDDDEEEPDTELRVDADVDNNRLLVRGTAQQIDEVRDLLVKLGEPIGDVADNRRVRVYDAVSPEDAQRLLEKVRRAWPSVGGGATLDLPEELSPNGTKEPEEPRNSSEKPDENDVAVPTRQADSPFRLMATSDTDTPPKAPGRVAIEVDSQGRLVLTSDNAAALDRLEELLGALAPTPPRFEVFRVTNRRPVYVVEKLEVYFEEELTRGQGEPILDWWGRLRGTQPKDNSVRLSKRRRLRFLADDWSSSVLVANANPAQLEEIGRLIDAWDRKPIDERVLARRTETIKLRYSKASEVVASVKSVYRDMLSKRDKAFDKPDQRSILSSTDYLTTIRYRDAAGEQRATEPTFIGFDGVLSIGADDRANVVIVSASEEIFDSVVETVRMLDEEARPQTTVRVVQLEGGTSPEAVRRALREALEQQGAASPQSQRSDRGDRGRRGRR